MKFTLFSILLLILLIVGCKDSSIQSHYTAETVKIDGNLDEWAQYPLQNFEEESFSVSFLNNQKEIYMIFATRDRQLMRIVQTSGINIWLDTDKKKKKNYSLHYVGNIDSLNFTRMPGNMPPDIKEQADRKRQKPGTLLVTHNDQEQLIEYPENSDPKASVDMYKSVYLLEVRIPFADNQIFTNLKENETKKINIGLGLGEDRSALRKQMQGMHPDDFGGGMSGGGMRGGGMMGEGPPSGGRPKRIGKIEKWFTVALENKK